MFSFTKSSSLIIFDRIVMLLYLISSFPLTVPYVYVSIESINYILLSLFELNAILLISSLKTLRLLLVNLCCGFSIYFCFLRILHDFLRLSMLILFFF